MTTTWSWRSPRVRPVVMRTLRLTLAAVVSYLVALALFDTPQPLTGPLTALLVVQATLYSTLTTGLRRVLSVVAGVLLAVVLSSVVGLTWWSLGAAIGASIVVGELLRLGEHLLEVPISAMLVLGVSGAETFAVSRVAETLVGAVVGVLVNVVLPPTVRTRSATGSVQRVADEAADRLDAIADQLPDGVTADQARGWLDDVRGLNRYVELADRALQDLGDSRWFNPRAVGTLDPGPVLRSGLDALEHSTVALRALFRSIADGVRDNENEPGYDDELRAAFAVLLRDLAGAVRAFGAVVRAEAESADGRTDERVTTHPVPEQPLVQSLEALRETRARVTELLLVDAGSDPGLWQVRGSLLAAVERVLVELDVEQRARRRREWQRDAVERRRAARDPRARTARAASRWRELAARAPSGPARRPSSDPPGRRTPPSPGPPG
ncbi:FUSC family protein [Angustibacter peucedani]